jgi:hypothetical protein
MSEIMLHGVLRMPVEMWHKDSPIDDIQRHCRYLEASKLIYSQADKIAELEKNISMLEQYNGSVESLIKDIKAHNLEQQAKGINELVAHLKVNTSYLMFTESTFREVEGYYDFLLDQAKALKEGKQ